jgi:murein DD-endopeptidase MepM/ murein hydrolase activator NlpD
VDLAAPTGTPIRSVGDGSVLEAGRNGGSGIMVKIRHDRRYMTAYKHLSKVGSGIRAGSKIEQGQIIGYVGQTGLASGPHLHFEFYEDGKYVDPMGKRFPHRDVVEPKDRAAFRKEVKRLSNLLQRFKEVDRVF